MTTLSIRNSVDRARPRAARSINTLPFWRGLLLIPLACVCSTLSPQARAVCEEGCDFPLSNMFLGEGALGNNTTGIANTAVGNDALSSNTTGNDDTAIGANALNFNTTGSSNTATGTTAFRFNTTGGSNTATGSEALYAKQHGQQQHGHR